MMEHDKSSFFEDVEMAPSTEVFHLTKKYNEDTSPNKVNLAVEAYRSDEGKPWVLSVVRTAEGRMATDETLNHEYLPVSGMPDFRTAACKLLLGKDSPAIIEKRVEGIQTIGGTGAIRLCAEFCKKVLGYDNMYTSDPTSGNHMAIFKACGFSSVKQYRYWNPETKALNFEGMIEDLRAAPDKTVVILHGCCHYPTGIKPNQEQWIEIVKLVKERGFLVLLDEAYQGFATGDLEKDGGPARYLCEQGLEFFVSQSFSSNFGLYNERVGNLVIVSANSNVNVKVRSQMEQVIRTTLSNPPNHGARVVDKVLNSFDLLPEWKENVRSMASRIIEMRKTFRTKMSILGTRGTWDHIINLFGMFSFTGLNPSQVDVLTKKFHIYLLKNGQINMSALTYSNIDYVANAIHEVVSGTEL